MILSASAPPIRCPAEAVTISGAACDRGDGPEPGDARQPGMRPVLVIELPQPGVGLVPALADCHCCDLDRVPVLRRKHVVAGRSGSAFTAHIGTMRVNEEIDAMQTMGLNTVDTLVLPRIIGLVIALPVLTFFSDIVGLIGGAAMCYFKLGITIPAFLRQLNEAVTINTLMVGLIKAPVFAFVIALVGCYEGFQVERNAASVGQLTTRSVVESIFLIIVLDAAFSVMFSVLGV